MHGTARPVATGMANLGTYGIWARSDQLSPELARDAERLGYGAVWLGGSPGDLGRIESLLEATDSLVVATGVVNMWQTSPAVTADWFSRLEQRHPGRFLLGLGIGHREATAEYRSPYATMTAYLDDLDEVGMPTGGRVLAALGPRVLTLAADRAAGAHPYLVPPAHTALARERMGVGPLLAPEHKVLLDADPARARATARDVLARYLRMSNYRSNLQRLGFTDRDLDDGGSDALVDALVGHGDPDAVARVLQQHRDAGADHVAIQFLDEDVPSAARTLAGALRLG